MHRAWAILAVFPASAYADAGGAIKYSERLMNACFVAQSGQISEACALLPARQCEADSSGNPVDVQNACRKRELAQWDEIIADKRGALAAMEDLADLIAPIQKPSPFPGGTAQTFADWHAAWLEYRDSACAYTQSLWQGQPGAVPARLSCEVAISAHYAVELDRLIGWRSRGFAGGNDG